MPHVTSVQAVPQTDFTSARKTYRAEAVIDWIDITITTVRQTQFQWVQAELVRILDLSESGPAIYVRPISPAAGAACRRFTIRFHDKHANRLKQLERITDQLSKKFPFSAPTEVTGIELALDMYGRGDADIVSMTRRLQNSIAAYSNPRQYDPVRGRNRFLAEGGMMNPLHTLYVGNKGDAISWRIYHKTTDNNQLGLDRKKHRARAEVTLLEGQLGCIHLAALRSLRFERFASFLHFRRLLTLKEITAEKSQFFAAAVARVRRESDSIATYPLGKFAYRRDARTNQPRNKGMSVALEHSRHTVADDELNRIARDKLRSLTRSFRN